MHSSLWLEPRCKYVVVGWGQRWHPVCVSSDTVVLNVSARHCTGVPRNDDQVPIAQAMGDLKPLASINAGRPGLNPGLHSNTSYWYHK